MDLAFTAEQLALRGEIVRFARRELNVGIAERDREHGFSRALWERCAEMGIQGPPFPQEYGGSGASILTTMLAMGGLGFGCLHSGLIFGGKAPGWGGPAASRALGPEAKKEPDPPPLGR